jgi:hypothetical protein
MINDKVNIPFLSQYSVECFLLITLMAGSVGKINRALDKMLFFNVEISFREIGTLARYGALLL